MWLRDGVRRRHKLPVAFYGAEADHGLRGQGPSLGRHLGNLLTSGTWEGSTETMEPRNCKNEFVAFPLDYVDSSNMNCDIHGVSIKLKEGPPQNKDVCASQIPSLLS